MELKVILLLAFSINLIESSPVNHCNLINGCEHCVRSEACTWAIIEEKGGRCVLDKEVGRFEILLTFHRKEDCEVYEGVKDEYNTLFGKEEISTTMETLFSPNVSAIILLELNETENMETLLSPNVSAIIYLELNETENGMKVDGIPAINNSSTTPTPLVPRNEKLKSKKRNNKTTRPKVNIYPKTNISREEMDRNTDANINTIKIYDKEPLISQLKRSLCYTYRLAMKFEKQFSSLYYAMPQYYVYALANPMRLKRLECEFLAQNRKLYKNAKKN